MRASHAARSAPTAAASARHAARPSGDSRPCPPAARHIASTASSSTVVGSSSWFVIETASGTTRPGGATAARRRGADEPGLQPDGQQHADLGSAHGRTPPRRMSPRISTRRGALTVSRATSAPLRRVARPRRGVEEAPSVDGLLEHDPPLGAERGVEVESEEGLVGRDPSLERRELAGGRSRGGSPSRALRARRAARHQVDERAGVLAEERRVEQHDEVGARRRRRLVARRPERRARRPGADVDDVVVDLAGRGVGAVPEGADRRPAGDERVVAEPQLGDDLRVQPEQEGVDEGGVGGQATTVSSGSVPAPGRATRARCRAGTATPEGRGRASARPGQSVRPPTPTASRTPSEHAVDDRRARDRRVERGPISALARSRSNAVATGWPGRRATIAPSAARSSESGSARAPRRAPAAARARRRRAVDRLEQRQDRRRAAGAEPVDDGAQAGRRGSARCRDRARADRTLRETGRAGAQAASGAGARPYEGVVQRGAVRLAGEGVRVHRAGSAALAPRRRRGGEPQGGADARGGGGGGGAAASSAPRRRALRGRREQAALERPVGCSIASATGPVAVSTSRSAGPSTASRRDAVHRHAPLPQRARREQAQRQPAEPVGGLLVGPARRPASVGEELPG